jgi:hypothetical protein
MEPVDRFNSTVMTITVAVMYVVIEHVIPLVPLAGLPAETSKAIIVLLSTVGTYTAAAKALYLTFDHSVWVRQFVLGPSFLAGTWIGCYSGANNQRRFTVEIFEQRLNRIVVRGWAFAEDGKLHADWISDTAEVDPRVGTLVFSYNCQVYASKTKHQGIAVFHFVRPDHKTAANELIGYSADLTDGERTQNHEFKLSDTGKPLDEALQAAREEFP